MKKLLIIITLFVSSFFLFCNKEVNASELTLDINFDLINDTFLEVKRLSDEFLQNNTNYDTYIIFYDSKYYVGFFNNSSNRSFNCNIGSNKLNCGFYVSVSKYYYNSSKGFLVSSGSSTNFTSYDYSSNFNNILYSTITPSHTGGYAVDIINLNYSGNTRTILYEELIPLVYDLYLEINSSEQENPHQEEIDKVTNFYTMVIEKIGYLAEQIANNYILLFIIGIFILMFVFMLIFRRLLC